MRLTRRIFISVLLVLAGIFAYGQDIDSTKYIQIDGLTLDETGSIVPYVGIYSFKLRRGGVSDNRGIFSVISTPGDTVFYTLSGYRPTLLLIPEKLTSFHFITDVHIIRDTITIEEVVVLPWKTYSEFKRAVAQAKTNTPETENMNFNIALIKQQIYSDLNATPGEGYRYTMQQMSDNLYSRGQTPYNNLLNPMAWTRFIKGLKSGLLRNEDAHKKKHTKAKIRKKKNN
jgi:hypothetical protein